MNNEEVLYRVKDERNIVQIIKTGKSNWIGHIKIRNCRPKYVIGEKVDGRIDVMIKRGIRRKQILGYFRVIRGCCKLKQEALDHTVWRTRLGRSCETVVRQKKIGITFRGWILVFQI